MMLAADRFQLPDLLEICVANLGSSISIENLAERIMLADRCRAPLLMQECIEYLRSDLTRLAELMDTDGYEQLSKSQMSAVMSALAPPSKKRARSANLAADPDMSKEAIKRLKVSELKETLKLNGLDVNGLKSDLIERLTNAVHGHQLQVPSSGVAPMSLEV
jgi:hypothetical protein